MKKDTNMDKIREKAKLLLSVDIAETRVPFIASHPFTSSWITMASQGEIIDLHDPEAAKKWRKGLEEEIDDAELISLFLMLNSPYILTFLKFTWMHMSSEDLGTVLGSFWQQQENISGDKNITGEEIVKMFRSANKDTLMDEEERERYASFPELVTVYRGVTSYNKRNKKAFSWTTDREIAEWFANRFDTGTGEVWTLTVPKERILCAFSGGEQEVIVNLYRYKDTENMLVEKV